MSLPAADSSAPIAVLILAWGEATPAVRAMVEATQATNPTVDSILVMVPQGDAPDHLSAEEYLPLPPTVAAPPLPPAEAAPIATQPTSSSETTLPPATEPAQLPLAATVALAAATSPAPLASAATTAQPSAAAEATPTTLGWAAVRVLRLGSFSVPQLASRAGQSLPAPTWTGTAQLPATPYLGAAPLAATPSLALSTAEIAGAVLSPDTSALSTADAPEKAVGATSPPAATPEFLTDATLAPRYELAEPQAALETDLPPSEEEEIELTEASGPCDLLSEEPLLPPSAVQAGWPEALAALRQPTTLAEPTLPELAAGSPPAPGSPAPGVLHPTATQYSAPDLNFQVIQYARFAVPLALAEPEFAAIYAPAWPTWLAAQELRQRTSRPLVLHVSTLAAADEPVSTATGWMAELQRQALQRADLILTETPALAERLRRELGLPFAVVQAIAAADALAIAQALHTARPRSVAGQS